MASPIKQTFVMIRTNLLSLPRRWAISLSMTVSVALVVCVLAGFLTMAKGFEKALNSTGSPVVAVVLGGGTNQETGSDVPASAIRTLEAMTDDFGVVRDAFGNLMLSREIVVPVDVKQTEKAVGRILMLRGMDVASPSIREGITLSAGRFFSTGARELVVGERLSRDFPIFKLGGKVRLGAVDWTVVGHFSATDRTVEIATVRALGFSRFSAFLATWAEAVTLAAAGVSCGIVASWLIFNGWQSSTVGTNNTNMGFLLAVTGDVMVTAGLLGLAIGIVGGALPAIAATRLPLTAALRARG